MIFHNDKLSAAKTFLSRKQAKYLPESILCLMVCLYVLVYAATIFNQHNRFWFGNFDLGIFDQGVWLLSQLHNPYLTTRGLNLFGDHATFIHLLIAPVYWIWNDVKALLFLHTLALALGALPLYYMARRKLNSGWAALILCFSYLMFPALHYSNIDSGYHSESFAVPLILWGHFFLMRRDYKKYFLAVFLAFTCKEEIALTYVLYGVYAAYRYNRRIGVATSAFAVIYLVFVLNIVFPLLNGESAFYAQRTIGSFGETTTDKIRSATNASFMWGKISTEKNKAYVWQLLSPVGFLVFLEPHAFICSASLWINLFTDWPYSHELKYHYVTPIIPIIFISLIEGLSRWVGRRTLLWILLCVLFGSTLYGNYVISPAESSLRDINRPINEIKQFDSYSPDSARIYEMIKKIPSNASVSASYNLVPHLAHRKIIYMFPNPYRVSYFGHYAGGKSGAADKEVDFVLLDMGLVGDEETLGSLDAVAKSGNYTLIDRYKQFGLWKNAKYIYS